MPDKDEDRKNLALLIPRIAATAGMVMFFVAGLSSIVANLVGHEAWQVTFAAMATAGGLSWIGFGLFARKMASTAPEPISAITKTKKY